jgi:hypothetical protein
MERWMKKRKDKWLSERPVQEFKLPLMVLASSGVIFILLTALFGVTIDTRTRTVNWSFEPGSDWVNPVIGKSIEDRYHVNPMTQFPWFCFIAMILGYFIAAGMFIIGWLHYCKWKTIQADKRKEVVESDRRRDKRPYSK